MPAEHLISPNSKCQTLELETCMGTPQTFGEHSDAAEGPPGSPTTMLRCGRAPSPVPSHPTAVQEIGMWGGFQGESCDTETLKAGNWRAPLVPGEWTPSFLAGREPFSVFLAIFLLIPTSLDTSLGNAARGEKHLWGSSPLSCELGDPKSEFLISARGTERTEHGRNRTCVDTRPAMPSTTSVYVLISSDVQKWFQSFHLNLYQQNYLVKF